MLHVPHLRAHSLQHQESYDDIIRQPQHLMPPPELERNVRQVNESNSSRGTSGLTYYRVVYRGVVALLSQPESSAPRSGCYLGYGEVVASRCQINNNSIQSAIRVDQVLTGGYAFDHLAHSDAIRAEEDTSETPKKSNIQGYTTTTTTFSPVSANNLAISKSSSSDGSSSLNNIVESSCATSEALLRCDYEGVRHYGFVLCRKNNVPIVEPLLRPPKCQHGRFFYKVVSSTPLPILSGPSVDAPLSKAMVLPGTVHEVSFRIQIDGDGDVWFLRLGRRKGYIASCRIRGRPTSNNRGNELLVKDVTEEINASGIQPAQSGIDNDNDDATNTTATTTTGGNHSKNTASTSSVVLSVLSTSMASCSTLTARNPNRRHRPPRRRRDTTQDNQNARNQRMQHVNHTINNNNHTSTNTSCVHNDTSTLSNISVQSQYSSDRLHQVPSCNVSLLSEDDSSAMGGNYSQQQTSFSSHEYNNKSHNCPRFNGALSPDRSVARSSVTHQSSQQQQQNITFFLMRVTAPRGLRILDAPHFQVNTLIHGQSSSTGGVASVTFAPNVSADVAGMSGLNSNKNQHHLFHTMAGRLTNTNGSGLIDNAIIFDSVTKTRILPRGAVFEASKRMEVSDALLQQGVGLIKLADNSGWAIVPHQKDLEQQYRNYHGGASSVKEGEATRGGYEEIGNAVVFQSAPSENLDQSFSHSRTQDSSSSTPGVFMRVVARQGATVVCAPLEPPVLQDNDNLSPASSPASSAVTGGTHPDQLALGKSDSASDVASSVGSSFLDAMFRPKRSEASDHMDGKQSSSGASAAHAEKPVFTSTTIVSFL